MTVRSDPQGIYEILADLGRACFIVDDGVRVGATGDARDGDVLAAAPATSADRLGSGEFRRQHGVRRAYMCGSMAGGIASVELVAAMAQAGYVASFGAAGVSEQRLDAALNALSRRLSAGTFAANLIHSPHAPRSERRTVELYLRHDVRCIEASAFVRLTPELLRYRLTGLRHAPDGGAELGNRLIAKVSRAESAELFARPAPETIVAELVAAGDITSEQAALARSVPVADDITIEADSGGHTDRRVLVTLLPQAIRLVNQINREHGYRSAVRVGAAGGIGSPDAAMAAFALGAAYVVTGSINQACVEADTSPAAKRLLAAAGPADYVMAPAADMFEMGIDVQVLRRGTMFAGRAARLYELYRRYDGLEQLPQAELRRLEHQILGRAVADVWADTRAYLGEHDASELERAHDDPKRRMALVFRWYLGMSSRWASAGDADRISDFQIWCGPAMGAFNEWVRGSALEAPSRRRVVAVAEHLMSGAAYASRICGLHFAGVRIPAACRDHRLPAPDVPGSDREAQACGS